MRGLFATVLGGLVASSAGCGGSSDASSAHTPRAVSTAKPSSSGPRCPTPIASRAAIATLAPPPGWTLTVPPASKKCGNLSRNEWNARLAPGASSSVEIALHEKGASEDPLPFKIDGKARDGLGGTRHVRAVEDGWLVGFDAAEVGGALWWFDKNGERRVKLSDGNVIDFVDLGAQGVLALTGFARGGFSRGQVLRVRRAGEWTATKWLDLDSAAEAFALESRDALLVLTTTGIFRLTACGDLTRLAQADYDALYPTSLAVDPRGVIYVGMRHYITRFVPASGSKLREEWLTREDCAKSEVRHFECVCMAPVRP